MPRRRAAGRPSSAEWTPDEERDQSSACDVGKARVSGIGVVISPSLARKKEGRPSRLPPRRYRAHNSLAPLARCDLVRASNEASGQHSVRRAHLRLSSAVSGQLDGIMVPVEIPGVRGGGGGGRTNPRRWARRGLLRGPAGWFTWSVTCLSVGKRAASLAENGDWKGVVLVVIP